MKNEYSKFTKLGQYLVKHDQPSKLGLWSLDSQIFFEVTGPPTRGCVLGMGAGVKPRDVYGPSSSSQCSKRCQADRLKEKEDFELCFKDAEDKSSAEKMEL